MLTPRNLPRSPTVVSGRQIVSDFKKNNVVATASYERICTTLESFERLETAALAQILDQLLDLADILDESCTRLVKALTRLPWIAISEAQDVAFQNLLTELAIRHIVHTETVLGAAIDHLIPAVEKPEPGNTEMKLLLSAEKQDELFKKSFLLISQILKCIPMAGRLLIRDNGSSLIRDRFPHHSRCSLHFIGYVKSLLQLCEVVPYLREQIFSLLIDRLAAIDAREAGSKKSSDKSGTLFLIDEGIAEMSDGETEPFSRNPEAASEKLDISLSYCLGYLNVLHGVETSTDMSWLRVYDQHPEDPDSVFHFTKRTFEHYVLMASGLQFVPFLWFHLASLHEKHVEGMLSWLWSMVQRPGQSPNDWRKSQAAATYIAAFIARANVTMRWLRQLAEWLTSYVNQVGLSSAKMAPGGARHGTFYAVAQAFFIAFCFRYTDIVNAGEMDEIRRWGLGHIIHSPLEPLRYASRHVALCFAVITRSLQLVYCNHVIPLASDDVRRPFEVFFPFERCQYERILETISPLMRSFSPLAEDVPKLAKELQMAMPKAAVEENSMDFLDEDDDFRIATESILMPSSRSSVFTVYPSSPGLRPFDFELR